ANPSFNWLPCSDAAAAPVTGAPVSLRATPVEFAHPMMKHTEMDREPSILLFDTGQHVFGELFFPRRRFEVATMERFARHFLTWVAELSGKGPCASGQDVAPRGARSPILRTLERPPIRAG